MSTGPVFLVYIDASWAKGSSWKTSLPDQGSRGGEGDGASKRGSHPYEVPVSVVGTSPVSPENPEHLVI